MKMLPNDHLGSGIAVSLAFSALLVGSTASAVVTYDTRALTGDAAPGTDSGVMFSGLSDGPVIDSVGGITFFGRLTSGSVSGTMDSGIWSDAGGPLALVVQEGALAPGTSSGETFRAFFDPVLSVAGQTALRALLDGTAVDSSNDTGYWFQSGGSLTLVAREGDAAPGAGPDAFYASLNNEPLLNAMGQTTFRASLSGAGVTSSDNGGIWSGVPGSLAVAAREGDAAPGAGPNANYSSFGNPVLNSAGQIAFSASLAGSGVDGSNSGGIWSGAPSSLALIARRGQAAPGAGGDAKFSFLGNPVINSSGQIALNANLTGSSVTAANNRGVWSNGGGSLALVARRGDAAPGAGSAAFDFFGDVILNSAGQTTFLGILTGPGVDSSNDTGIWSEGGGSLALVARTGDAVPGPSAGVVFSRFVGRQALNGLGQVAFEAELAGTAVTSSNDESIWLANPDGLLTLIARSGVLFDVDDDPLVSDLRTISSVGMFNDAGGSQAGRNSPFDDAQQLAFWLEFTDGSEGIFVATIPEPASLALLGLGTLAMLLQRRSR